MEFYFLTLFFVLGAVMGSFFHVVASRVSNDESIIYPGSHCPNCSHPLKWYENIPIFSYIFLKGKCSECKTKIPISYLVVEIVTGVLYAVCFHSFKLSLNFAIALIFVSALVTVIVSDIEYMIILDEVLMISTLLIIITYFIGNSVNLGLYNGLKETAVHIYSAVGAFGVMYAVKLLGDKAFKKESLGGGDIKLMFLFGLVLDFPIAICTIFLATFIAFPIAIIILISDKENIIPFGPFLSMAAILLLVSKFDLLDIINLFIK